MLLKLFLSSKQRATLVAYAYNANNGTGADIVASCVPGFMYATTVQESCCPKTYIGLWPHQANEQGAC